jgi:sulfide:quinone oxidoreductase
MPPPSAEDRVRVLIAGGGIAAIETLLALDKLAPERVELHLLAAEDELVYRPLATALPFRGGDIPRYDLARIADGVGAKFTAAALKGVDLARGFVSTDHEGQLPYDFLVLAVGAHQRAAVTGALTFRGVEDVPAYFALLYDLELERAKRVAFALPSVVSWSLPLYELALMTAARARFRELEAELTLVTPESTPLGLFGPRVSAAVADLLAEAGVVLRRGYPEAIEDGELVIRTPDGRLAADRVVALARPEGPRTAGVPHNAGGFLETDLHGKVWGTSNVYAAGDATAFPIKQGGIAAHQADVVAHAIAVRAGAQVRLREFEPVLRGKLLTGQMPRFMRSAITGGKGATSTVAEMSLWWPPTKIAAHYLSTYLAGIGVLEREEEAEEPEGIPVEVAFEQAVADAGAPVQRGRIEPAA